MVFEAAVAVIVRSGAPVATMSVAVTWEASALPAYAVLLRASPMVVSVMWAFSVIGGRWLPGARPAVGGVSVQLTELVARSDALQSHPGAVGIAVRATPAGIVSV